MSLHRLRESKPPTWQFRFRYWFRWNTPRLIILALIATAGYITGMVLSAWNWHNQNMPAVASATPTPFLPVAFTTTPTITATPTPTPQPTACIVSPDEFMARAVVGSTDFVVSADKAGVVMIELDEDVVLYSDAYVVARGYEYRFEGRWLNGSPELHTTVVLYASEEEAQAAYRGSDDVVYGDWQGDVNAQYQVIMGRYEIVIKTKHLDSYPPPHIHWAEIVKGELSCD